MEGWLNLLLIAFVVSSCQLGTQEAIKSVPSQISGEEVAIMQKSTMFDNQFTQEGLPENLISQEPILEIERSATPSKSGSLTRLYQNGHLYSWSDSRRILVDGLPSREPVSYAWRLDAQVSDSGISQLQDVIKADFFSLVLEEPSSTAVDQGLIKWQVYVDNREHTVILPASAYDQLPPIINEIERLVQSNIVPGGVPIEQ